MIRSIAFAPLAMLGALSIAPMTGLAQAPTDLAAAPAMNGNVVGGGGASISGGGVDRTITFSSGGAGGGARYEQPGRIGTFAGNSGGNPSWTYDAATPLNGGREAWLLGGAEDARILYQDPAGTRRR